MRRFIGNMRDKTIEIEDKDLENGQIPLRISLIDKKYFFLCGCKSLTSLPELPKLIKLDLTNCCKLIYLPKLPDELTDLNLRGCKSLIFTPDLINQLSDLERDGAIICYPTHFNLEEQSKAAKEKLESAINSYKTMNPDSSIPRPQEIVKLLNRYLTENIEQYGARPQEDGEREDIGASLQRSQKEKCLKKIILTTIPILAAFNHNPNHLKWAEEIAKEYLGACVNQPVRGWSEISAITSIAQAAEVTDKIKAAGHLMVIEAITKYITDLPQNQKPDVEVEAEAENALFREVHNRLLKSGDIEQAWLGVPKSIAHEGEIAKWLTEEKITSACNQAKATLTQSPSKVATYLCEGFHREAWADIAFPMQVAEIKNGYQQKMELLEEKIRLLSQAEAEIDKETQKLLAEIPNQETNPKSNIEKLLELQANLPNLQDLAIATKVSELTNQAIVENAMNHEVASTPRTAILSATSQRASTFSRNEIRALY